ncbi:MAG: TetR/AcrR family transcriptional regulator C-terminal domain-containing protein [Solobacterium sp.]|nr:TetR/AcrR family transcriptional regulator C-terminal domain-containing protein [Solobacterium sp.]
MKKLLKKKPLDKIRITEICQAAEIERSTFYYHFKDKYDLVAWIFYHDAFRTNVTDVKEAADSMRRVRRDVLVYRRALEDNSQNALLPYMTEYFTDVYTQTAKARLKTDILDEQTAFSIRLYCYGAVHMAKEWLLTEDPVPAEQIIQMMFASMPQFLREIYFD